MDFAQIPYVIYIGNLSKVEDFRENPSACLQMDRSRSSRGVGWSNGYWGIVTSKRTPRLARLEVRRKSLNMISRPCVFFFVFLHPILGSGSSPIEIL